MGSQYPPSCRDEDGLDAFERVFLEVWGVMAKSDQCRHAVHGRRLRAAVLQHLWGLVDEGVVSGHELRVRTLAHFGFHARS